MTTVLIPVGLRVLTGGQAQVTASGRTVAELIANLDAAYPGIKARLCDDRGEVHRFINLFYNDQDIRAHSNLETPVEDSGELVILPAIAGGVGA